MDKIQLCIQKLEGYSRWEPGMKMKSEKEQETGKKPELLTLQRIWNDSLDGTAGREIKARLKRAENKKMRNH